MKVIQLEIRKGIKELDDTDGIIIKVANSKDFIIVENDYLTFGIKDMFRIRYSSMWFAFKVLFKYAFSIRKIRPVLKLDLDIEKYSLEIFAGLEEMCIVNKNEFFLTHEKAFGMHPQEPIWMGGEFEKLNKAKFIKYLNRHRK